MKKRLKKQREYGGALCTAFLAVLGVALPLCVHHAYFDITITKATVYWVLSGLLLIGWAALLLRRSESMPHFDRYDLLFAVFALTQIVSTLLFRSSSNALTAPDNRCQGVLSFVCYLLVFVLLRRRSAFTPLVRWGWLLGFSVAALLAVAELFGHDLLGLRALSPEIELPRFFSTLGNISFISALCVLFLPLASCLALSAEKPREAAPYALCALLALLCGLAARAESFVLGVLAFFALLPLFARSERMLRRVPLLWAGAALAAALFTAAMAHFALYRPSELTRLVFSPPAALAVVLVSVLLRWRLRRASDAAVFKARKVYMIVFFVLLAALTAFLVLANTALRERLGGRLSSVVVFSPSWGTDRGAVWISFRQMFREAPLLKKLIGSGAGSLAAWDRTHRVFPDAVTDTAHNEYLHYLLTGGLLGLGAYLTLLAAALRRALKRPTRCRTALGLACASYAVQATVNIAQPFSTPLFFAMLTLLFSDDADEERQGENELFWRAALCALALALLLAGSFISRTGA